MYRKTICTRKTPDKCGNYDAVVKMHTEHIGVKVRVRNRVHSCAEKIVCWVCIYVEAIYTNTWSARSKTVEIQNSNWHKEYGE